MNSRNSKKKKSLKIVNVKNFQDTQCYFKFKKILQKTYKQKKKPIEIKKHEYTKIVK